MVLRYVTLACICNCTNKKKGKVLCVFRQMMLLTNNIVCLFLYYGFIDFIEIPRILGRLGRFHGTWSCSDSFVQ